MEKKDDARIRVTFTVLTEPDLTALRRNKGVSSFEYCVVFKSKLASEMKDDEYAEVMS